VFSVYGVSGQIFSGTKEAMERGHRLSRARHAREIAGDNDETGAEAVVSRPTQEALRAYRAMLPEDLERGPLVHAAQVMSCPAISVAADAKVSEAWHLLRDYSIHQAPVLDAGSNLVGIVSERDLLMVIDIDGRKVIDTLHRLVRDVMTTPVIAAAPVTDIRRVAATMLSGSVDGVPVVGDNGRLLGFVSRSDVLRAVITDPPLSLWR
jgi:CBS domain-containing protein